MSYGVVEKEPKSWTKKIGPKKYSEPRRGAGWYPNQIFWALAGPRGPDHRCTEPRAARVSCQALEMEERYNGLSILS